TLVRELNRLADEAPEPGAPAADDPNAEDAAEGGRPLILITSEEHQVNAAAVKALANDKSLYQRAGMLVRVVRDKSPKVRGVRRRYGTRIDPLPAPLLRERMAAAARWATIKKGISLDGHPPAWCVAAVLAHADYPGVRHLEAVVEYPVLKPNGR